MHGGKRWKDGVIWLCIRDVYEEEQASVWLVWKTEGNHLLKGKQCVFVCVCVVSS